MNQNKLNPEHKIILNDLIDFLIEHGQHAHGVDARNEVYVTSGFRMKTRIFIEENQVVIGYHAGVYRTMGIASLSDPKYREKVLSFFETQKARYLKNSLVYLKEKWIKKPKEEKTL